MAGSKLVVIGNGMVGQRLLEKLAATTHDYAITVLCEEPRPAYDRVALTSFLAGRSADDLSLVPAGFFAQPGIALHLNERATAIDRQRRVVTTGSGRSFEYDKLVLATGSYPFVPPIPGREREHCFVYRTIEDLVAIREAARHARRGAVIGGGLLGLEAARALLDLGLETHVVEFAPRLMAVQVDEGGGRVLRRHIESLGVRVHAGRSTAAIEAGTEHAHALRFADGEALDTDIVVFSAGIRPQDALARECGLAVGPRGGIVIDDGCATSDADIYAIGECALWQGKLFGLVAPGYQMAATAADALLGVGTQQFKGADMSTKLKLMGVDVASLGDAQAMTPDAQCCTLVDERAGVYKKLVLNKDGTRLIGGILVGDAADYGTWLQLLLGAVPLPAKPESLLLPAGEGGEAAGLGIAALPATAQVCSCNNVSKGDICAAVGEGIVTLGGMKKATRAASSCGGCGPLVLQLIKAELQRRGVVVDNHLCEHFPHSRQELFHLVKVGRITTFSELIAKHGKGSGCDVCKPTAASILASQYNEFVLKPDKAVLQDTNDRFLANLQKDGSYSVVPRIAGGEITPDKLLVIAQVAKKYGLYTKITGGQRIDLFGAQVNELPAIWRELIAAGFESGHAYGKSLRTVKSCVGSSWCRYGVQDSVGFAIELENRYKGLRSPHKLKFAVSGCTRECAEAQSKDVGIIATEKGWNLYVCGNGGMKPRHADLLASDLDRDTLIRYIDRFLMFYVRTADRLQRTAGWLENLEGGLDYLRAVVCEDKLGIATELEAAMQLVIGTYECEWKKAVEDPETLKRFRHFVNSERLDSNIVLVEERGQRRPASSEERARTTAKVGA
ncbi:MAG: nitrite reductase large subunit NirB [Pseudomonadota bacterium]